MTERKQKFHPPMGGRMAGGDKAKDVKGTTVKLLRYMRKDLFVIILAFALAIGGAVATVIVPDVLSGATDVLVDGKKQFIIPWFPDSSSTTRRLRLWTHIRACR